ncbi:hypothetical protein [Nocardia sp. NPDC052316]|uniref:hypothetical protein n=1 Tax=Nocardia sp. NPDC052316 TaxID=3364329 RepID=UPI0037C736D8
MRRKDDPTAAVRKFARDLAMAVLVSLIVAGLTRMTVFSGPPSKLEGRSRVVDDVGAAVFCLVMAVIRSG